jgi:hypothetical protein
MQKNWSARVRCSSVFGLALVRVWLSSRKDIWHDGKRKVIHQNTHVGTKCRWVLTFFFNPREMWYQEYNGNARHKKTPPKQ